ncbi:MAG: 2-dehydropantoate 2-reductase, partial [Chloroflexota bacterium]
MLNILVMGAGAIGCFVGGSLAAAGHRVTLVGRETLMQTITSEGLTILWPDGSKKVSSPQTTTTLSGLNEPYDFVLITVKTPATDPVIDQLKTHANLFEAGYIVSLQNGIGSEEKIASVVGQQKTIAGTVTIPIQVPEAGKIEVSKDKGGLGVAALVAGQPVDQLAQALNDAGLLTTVYEEYQAMKWSKLLLNLANNATSAILDLPPTQIINHIDLFNLEIEALRETVAVMRAQKI